MNPTTSSEIVSKKIKLLSSFREDIRCWFEQQYQPSDTIQLRSQIKQNVQRVKSIIMETSCLKLMPTIPPSATGGLIIRDYDPFNSILGSSHFEANFIPAIIEMIDEAITVLESPRYLAKLTVNLKEQTTK